VIHKVCGTQARELVREWKNEARLNSGLLDEFDPTSRARDVYRHTLRREQTCRMPVKRYDDRVKAPFLGNPPSPSDHVDVPAMDGIELSDRHDGRSNAIS
jgi:hypothetical protein